MANKTPNQTNNEDSQEDSVTETQKRIYASMENIKINFDKTQDPNSCIHILSFIKKVYDAQAIPFLKESYLLHPLQKKVFSARVDKAYEIFNETYEYGLKRAKELGVDDSVFSQLNLPKSLEKLTFPENN